MYDTQRQSVIYATQQSDDIVNIDGTIPKQTSDIHGITKEITFNKEHIDQFIGHFNQTIGEKCLNKVLTGGRGQHHNEGDDHKIYVMYK